MFKATFFSFAGLASHKSFDEWPAHVFPPTFDTGTPNVSHDISDSTPLFAQNTDAESQMHSSSKTTMNHVGCI